MPTLGLTGNIAAGKSHIAEIFRDFGALIYNADITAHEMMEGPAFEKIKEAFPESLVDGKIDRKKLGEIVFHDEEKLVQLEKILHPLVRKKNMDFIEANRGKLLVLEIPLLYETDAHLICDYTVFVNVSRETRMERALARPGLNPEKLEKIIARQTKIPVEEKMKRADFIIHNDKSDDARAQVKAIVAKLALPQAPVH